MPGNSWSGTLAGKRVAALSGRAHFYEGHELRTVTFATRVLGLLGHQDDHPHQCGRRHQPVVQARHADGDGRSHQPARQQSADRRKRGPVRSAISRHDRGVLEAVARRSPMRLRQRAASRWRTASMWRSTARATKRRRRSASCEPLAPTRSACRPCPEALVARHMGARGAGHLVYHQPRRGSTPGTAASCRSDGGRASRQGRVFVTAGGHH